MTADYRLNLTSQDSLKQLWSMILRLQVQRQSDKNKPCHSSPACLSLELGPLVGALGALEFAHGAGALW